MKEKLKSPPSYKSFIKNFIFSKYSEVDILIMYFLIIASLIYHPEIYQFIYVMVKEIYLELITFEKVIFVIGGTGLFILLIIALIKSLIKIFIGKTIDHGPEKDFFNMLFYLFIGCLSLGIFFNRISQNISLINFTGIFIILGSIKSLISIYLIFYYEKIEYVLSDRLENKKMTFLLIISILLIAAFFYFLILKNSPLVEKIFLTYIYTSIIINIGIELNEKYLKKT